MFPFDIDDDEIFPEVEEEKIPSDYEIDFNTGRLTGRIITGLDAIIQWVRIVIGTDRYFYPQYTWDHGVELNTLIGKNYDQEYIETEVKRMITDALMVNKYILGVDNFKSSMIKDQLSISFRINTIFGGGEISV